MRKKAKVVKSSQTNKVVSKHPSKRLFQNILFFNLVAIIIVIAVVTTQNFLQAATAPQKIKPNKGAVTATATDRIIVKYKNNVSEAQKKVVRTRTKLSKKSAIGKIQTQTETLSVPSGTDVNKLKNDLKTQNTEIEFAELDKLITPDGTTNDPNLGQAWQLSKTQALQAWDLSHADGVIIGDCDTGFDSGHPDLSSAFIAALGINIVDGTKNWSPVIQHGTSTAGTMAAIANNGTGASGIAWGARIIPVRISNLSNGAAYYSDAANCITYAVDNGAKVVNLSYRMADSLTIDAAARYAETKGAVVVVSAGNDGLAQSWPSLTFLAVGATDANDAKASFSNTGAYVDVVGPGVSVFAPYGATGYAYVSGTSFSAPMTSGLLALVFAANPSLTAAQAKQIIIDTVDDLGSAGKDDTFGYGRINALKAVSKAKSTTGTLPSPTSILQPSLAATVTPTPTLLPVPSISKSPSPFPSIVKTPTPTFIPTPIATRTPTPTPSSTPTPTFTQTPSPTPDIQKPTVTLLSPSNNAKVTGTISLQASATDNISVTKVEFVLDTSTLIHTTMVNPYQTTWNSKSTANGSHQLTAKAYDQAGNIGTSSILINVDNDTTPPVVTVLSPTTGETIMGNYQIKAFVTDNVIVDHVDVLLADQTPETLISTLRASPYYYTWNTNTLTNGAHILKVQAYDGQGNTSATTVKVTVQNDKRAPSISFVTPGVGWILYNIIPFQVNASDDVGVTKVVYSFPNSLSPVTVSSSPYKTSIDTRKLANGFTLLTATAYDTAGNTSTTSVLTYVNNDFTPPSLSITNPKNGGTEQAGRSIKLKAQATDSTGVRKVDFYTLAGSNTNLQKLVCTDSNNPYECTWIMPSGRGLSYTITAVAYDLYDQKSYASVKITSR